MTNATLRVMSGCLIVSMCVLGVRADRVYTAADYVRQADLIALWDGVDNVATGTHDPNATTWVDRIGGISVAITNGAVGANYVRLNAVHGFSGLDDVSGWSPAKDVSIEACARKSVSGTSYNQGALLKINSVGMIGQEMRQSAIGNCLYSWQKNGAYTSLYFSRIVNRGTLADLNDVHTYAAVLPVGTMTGAYYDGAFYPNNPDQPTFYTATGLPVPDGSGELGNANTKPELYCLRVYKGALTPAQVRANAVVDGIRFRGWTGYRVVDETAQAYVTVPAGFGTVTTNGSPVVGGFWADMDGSVTFTATPMAGCSFVGWTGDTSAIVSGTAQDATITVSVTKPLMLRANYTAAELVVSADTTLSASAVYSGIRFTGGYTLSAGDGVLVRLTDGGGICVESGTATLACPVQFGFTTDGAQIDLAEAPIVVASGAKLVCSATACLSGDAKVVVGHPGTVEMRAANTFNGSVLVTNGFFEVRSDAAFGTTRGGTTYDCTGRTADKVQMRFYGVTVPEDFVFECKDINRTALFAAGTSTTNALNGKLTAKSNFRWTIAADTTLVFGGTATNALTGCNCIGFGNSATSHMVCRAPTQFGHWYTGSGQYHFGAPVTIDGSYGLWMYQNGVTTDIPDAFSLNGSRVYLHFNNDGSTFDLAGNDQIFQFIKEDAAYPKPVIRSEQPATLRLLGVANSREGKGLAGTSYSGKFTEAVSLVVEGAKPFCLNGLSTSVGTLCVTNGGQLSISEIGGWAGGSVRVTGTGSRLAVSNVNAFAESVRITLDDGGVLALPTAGEYVFADLTIDGQPLDEATYPAGSAAFAGRVTGVGSVKVQKTKVEPKDWTWNDGAHNQDLFDGGNWEEEGTPNFADTSVQARFATSGTTAVFGGSPRFRKITFDSSADFTLATNAPNAELQLYDEGLVAAASASDRAYRLDAPVRLAKPQTWTVGEKSEVTAGGPVRSDVFLTLGKQGGGTVRFTAPTDWAGAVDHFAGTIVVGGGMLGGVGSRLTVGAGASVHYTGGTYGQTIKYDNLSSENQFQALPGSTNVFTAALDVNKKNTRLEFRKGSQTTFEGGVANPGYQMALYLFDGAEVVFAKACYLSNLILIGSGNSIFRFCDSGFTFETHYPTSYQGAMRAICDVDWAYARSNTNRTWQPFLLKGPAVFDLNGHEQGVGGFNAYQYARFQSDDKGAITSATPATLFVCQMKGVATNAWFRATSDRDDAPFVTRFTGAVSLSKSGSANLFLSGASPTTGRLEVTEGLLAFKDGGCWSNATEVAVLGGTLEVDTKGRLPKRVQTVRLGTNARLDIAAGVTLICQQLLVQDGDAWKSVRGQYGRGDLSGRLTGDGTLRTPGGVAIIVR